MHPQCRDYVQTALADYTPTSCIEIGARDVNGGIRDLLPTDCAYLGLDIAPGPGVDVVADAATWSPLSHDVVLRGPYAPRGVELVLCLEVLEHAPQWRDIVSNAASWLAPHGRLVITAACDPRAPHSAVDGGQIHHGEYYNNINPVELHDTMCPFGTVTVVVDPANGDVRATLTT